MASSSASSPERLKLDMPVNGVTRMMPRSPLDELGARVAEDLANGSLDIRSISPARRPTPTTSGPSMADDDDFFGGAAADDDEEEEQEIMMGHAIPYQPSSRSATPLSTGEPEDAALPVPARLTAEATLRRPASQDLPRLDTSVGGKTFSFPARAATASQEALPKEPGVQARGGVIDRERPRPSSFFGVDGQHNYHASSLSNGFGHSSSESTGQLPRSRTASSGELYQQGEGNDHPLARRSSFYGDAGPDEIPHFRRPSVANSDGGLPNKRSTFLPGARSHPPSIYGSPIEPHSAPPLLDHSHLKPGASASLLSHAKTLELYRVNAKKTNDPDVAFEFAVLLMEHAREQSANIPTPPSASPVPPSAGDVTPASAIEPQNASSRLSIGRKAGKEREPEPSPASSTASLDHHLDARHIGNSPHMVEAITILKRIADRGHVGAQALLGESYAQGIGTGPKCRPDHDKAFGLFVLAGKHGHAESCFRVGHCCEHGLGCRKDVGKAVTWYNKAAAVQHAGAMYRLGVAGLNSELSLHRKQKEGFKWLKRAAELAHKQPEPATIQALHELALLHERGIEHVVFVDFEYAAELLAKASELGYAPSAYKLGECYEYGKMGCPQDSALSIHYYNIAAQQGHREACFALTAWYLVGSPGVLPQSDTEAYLWAKKAAEQGLAKAEYAVGYFTEVGMGRHKDPREALTWFRRAAEHGDKRATARMRAFQAQQEQIAREEAARQAALRRAEAIREAERQRLAAEQREREERALAERRAAEQRERERIEREEAERLAAERRERDRLAKEAADRAAAEKRERDRLEREARIERERLEREARMERERAEREARVQRERAEREARAERQRLEKEAVDKATAERKERERLDRENQRRIIAERREQERLEREAAEARDREAQEIAERQAREQREHERAEKARRAAMRAIPGVRQDEYFGDRGLPAPAGTLPPSVRSPTSPVPAASFLASQPAVMGTPVSRLPPGAGFGEPSNKPRSMSAPRMPAPMGLRAQSSTPPLPSKKWFG